MVILFSVYRLQGMIINKSGITIRLKVAEVRIMGRATQGGLSSHVHTSTSRHIIKTVSYTHLKGYDVQFGARPLKRAIQNNLEDGISELILGSEMAAGDTIKVSYDKEKDLIVMTVAVSYTHLDVYKRQPL